ncbi:hypothetical protein BU631_10275 [Staphylococcus caprae]|nr:hypothetical protein BU631_10275 [Staphylococcus caprae]
MEHSRRPLLRRTNRTNRSQPRTQKNQHELYWGVGAPAKRFSKRESTDNASWGWGSRHNDSRVENPL